MAQKTWKLPVNEDVAGERADVFVARMLPEYSRAFWQKQFKLGNIRRHNVPLKASNTLTQGEVTIEIPDSKINDVSIPILYEDDDVIVLNKPAGILTHAKGLLTEEATVADFVKPRTTDAPESNRPGIVHRLDRDTSGVMIAAKNPEAKHWLQRQFAQRKVKKSYIALVEGHLQPAEALLRLPIKRNPKEPQKFRVAAGGKNAETLYKVTEDFPHHTLVVLQPHTGRTHQLRVHMAHLGHPIVGDRFYGKTAPSQRLLLHAHSLELTLPNKKRRVFTTPLPEDFAHSLKELK